jgi:hypothetical protein
VLPWLGLSFYKVLHQYERGYEEALHHVLAEREMTQAKVVAGDLPSRDVEALDTRLKDLAGAYRDFAGELATFDALAQGVRVNLLNLRECYARYSLPKDGPLAAWLASAERALAQLDADAGFYEARVRQAQMALSALQVQTEIERARFQQAEERRSARHNLLLAFIAAVLTLGQVMSDGVAAQFLSWSSHLVGRGAPAVWPPVVVFLTKLLLVWAAGLAGLGLYAVGARLLRRKERPQRAADSRQL